MHAGFLKRVLGAMGLAMVLSACGGGGGSSTTAAAAQAPQTAATHALSLFAGNVSGRGSLDGSGPVASFQFPKGITSDAQGNVYVADTFNHSVRKITPDGVVSTWAGLAGAAGSADGAGAVARFNGPEGLATDSSGNVYVADTGNFAIRKITPGGVVSTWAGTAASAAPRSFYRDGFRTDARFSSPVAVSLDRSGNLFVADRNNQLIRKISSDGMVNTLAGTAGASGSADGNGAAARFRFPNGVAADANGNVYVIDGDNRTLRKISAAGDVSTLASVPGQSGTTDGTGADARFIYLAGITLDASGNVLVSDMNAHTIRRITPLGEVSTWTGTAEQSGALDGSAGEARFFMPWGLALDAAGNVLVADYGNHLVRTITPTGQVSTLAGAPALPGASDGSGTAARFNEPTALASDSSGNVYVADRSNSTVRKITPSGVVSTLAGSAGLTGFADGLGSDARFVYPAGLAVDAQGNVFVADTGAHTIRKVTPLGEVSTFAGLASTSGADDGRGAAARFNSPWNLAFDSHGNLFVADAGNHTVRKITPEGEVSTFAGMADQSGYVDGTGDAVRFDRPLGMAVDALDNLYVVSGNATAVRKISPQGAVSTWVGSQVDTGSTDGAGAAARFSSPQGIAIDRAGNVYVADTDNHLVRKITPDAVVSTLGGTLGAFGQKMGTAPGALNLPFGICVVGDLVYVAMQNGIVRIQ